MEPLISIHDLLGGSTDPRFGKSHLIKLNDSEIQSLDLSLQSGTSWEPSV